MPTLTFADATPSTESHGSSSDGSLNKLNGFIQQVLESNPSIQAADANVSAVLARHQAAGQPLYNPSLTAEGQQSVDKYYAVGISQTIDMTNKQEAREEVGHVNLQIAEAQRTVLRQQLTSEILNALVRYQKAQEVVKLAKERTNLLEQFVELTQKRHANGDVARVDVDLAQLALSEAYAQEADVEVNVIQAVQTIRAITRQKPATWPRLPNPLPAPSLTKLNIEELIHCLPLVQVSIKQNLSAEARIRLAERERYPDPTFGIQGGQEKTDEKTGTLIGVSVSIPLFIRNTYRAEVDAANYDAIEAGKKRKDILQLARAEIESSAERYEILYKSVQKWQLISSKPLKEGIVLIERLWKAGEINTTDYLVQVKQRIDSQIAGVELQSRTWQAWVDWLKASGKIETWVKDGQTN
jgi:cobalt-zinc-cadmium efflux system outer membrane protein